MQSCCRDRAGFTLLPPAHVAATGPGFHDNLPCNRVADTGPGLPAHVAVTGPGFHDNLFCIRNDLTKTSHALLAPVLSLQGRVYGTARYASRRRLPVYSLLQPPAL